MRRSLFAPAAAAALLLTLSGGAVAVAQDTGPDSVACKEARQSVLTLQGTVDGLVAGPPGTLSLAGLKAAVQAAIDADNKVVPPLTKDSEVTVAAKAALAAREGLIADVKAKLDVAIGVRDKACDPAPTTTVTPPPDDPTDTATPTPTPTGETPTTEAPPSSSDDGDVADEAPSGAVDTGFAG